MPTSRLGALMEPMTPDSVKWFDVWISYFGLPGARRSDEIYRG
jgi:hypothetical protein